MMEYSLFTDGGSRNNPGQAAIGVVLYRGQEEIANLSNAIGIATNNAAEYQALLAGLELALRHKVKDLDCYLDSELVVRQLKREYRVKDKDLAVLFAKVVQLSDRFSHIRFSHIERAKNKRADQLVNQALDQLGA